MKPKILAAGHACLDIVHKVSKIPRPNQKVDSQEVIIQIGGNAANAAAALSDMGSEAYLCSVLGSEHHPFTRILTALLNERGVNRTFCRYDNSQPCPSSTIMVLDDGERAIMNWQGDAIKTSVMLPSSIDGFSMVMADAYRLPMVRQVFAMAKTAGIPTMIDIDGPVKDIGLVPVADFIWFSEEAWRSQRIPLEDLQSRFGGVVGITDGDRPVRWIDSKKKINYQQPMNVTPINTLGAGDVFRARFGLGICLGENIPDAVVKSCEAAAAHITGKPLQRIC
jgi:sugar/nucleoside kinase (ribokinase family)